jgi:hypothetical protein
VFEVIVAFNVCNNWALKKRVTKQVGEKRQEKTL